MNTDTGTDLTEPARSGLNAWFTGGDTPYMTLTHCMNHDYPWIGAVVFLTSAVSIGYAVIAWHWHTNQRHLGSSPAKTALNDLRNIFVLCAICGYLFLPIKLVWPGWRLYVLVLIPLVIVTWRYAISTRTLRVVYQELRRAERLETELSASIQEVAQRDRFLNAVSHDLKTPMAGMALQAEVVRRAIAAGDTDRAAEAATAIVAASENASTLLNRMLEVARSGGAEAQLDAKDVDIVRLCSDIVVMFREPAAAKGIELQFKAGLTSLVITTDRGFANQVVTNLIDNAIKFTENGKVTISVENSEEIRWQGEEQRVVITVEDTGPGIPREQLASIFDDFHQVGNRQRNPERGHGLGLAITRRLVHRLAGRIVVDSQLGRGSRFRVDLPLILYVQPISGENPAGIDR